MEEWYLLAGALFTIGAFAYPGWNLILRYDKNPFKKIKSSSKREYGKIELEEIFGM